ncbi:MAG: cell division protein FtsQ/DivIB [Anaerolineae bacterium]
MSRRQASRSNEVQAEELPQGLARITWWRWSRAPGLLVAILALVTLLGLVNGTRFVANVRIEGATLVPEAHLLSSVGIAGKSVFLVRPAEIERRLLDGYGCLEDVSVETRLPNLVLIQVQERSPVMVWESGGGRWWMDETGNVLGKALGSQGLITVEDALGHMPSPDAYVPGVPWKMARDVARQLGATPRFYFQEQGLTLYVHVQGNDMPAYLGSQGDGAVKAAVLEALVERLESEGLQPAYLDLSRESAPVFGVIPG